MPSGLAIVVSGQRSYGGCTVSPGTHQEASMGHSGERARATAGSRKWTCSTWKTRVLEAGTCFVMHHATARHAPPHHYTTLTRNHTSTQTHKCTTTQPCNHTNTLLHYRTTTQVHNHATTQPHHHHQQQPRYLVPSEEVQTPKTRAVPFRPYPSWMSCMHRAVWKLQSRSDLGGGTKGVFPISILGKKPQSPSLR